MNTKSRDTTRLLTGQTDRAHSELSVPSSALSIDSSRIISPWTSGTTLKDRSKKKLWKTNVLHCAWISLGIFLLIGSLQILWAPSYLNNIVHGGITEALVFTEESPNNDNYRKWQSNDQGADSIPIKVYMQVLTRDVAIYSPSSLKTSRVACKAAD